MDEVWRSGPESDFSAWIQKFPSPVAYVNQVGKPQVWSPALARLLWDPEGVAAAWPRVWQALDVDAACKQVEMIHWPVGDEDRFIEVQAQAWKNGFLISFTNVTDRYQSLTALQAAETRFYLLAQAASVGILRFRMDGGCIFVNHHWTRMAQLDLAKSLGKGWLDAIASEDRENLTPLLATLWGRDQEIHFEFKLRSAQQVIWIQARLGPERDGDGRLTGYLMTLFDVSDRKRAEAALGASQANMQAILDTSAEGIVTLDASGVILAVNHALEKMIGYRQNELFGLNFQKLIQWVEEPDPNPRPDAGQDFLSERRAWIRHRKGRRVPIAVRFKQVVINEERPLLTAIIRDETVVYELEEKFRHTQKMEGLGLLAGSVAHDFNNLLTAILGFAELGETAPDSAQNALQEIHKAGLRAKELVQQILTFSRKYEQEKVVVPLNSEVKEALNLVRGTLPSSVELLCELDPECGFVEVAQTQIHQILMNLCTNAYHALPDGIGTIRVSLSAVSRKPDWPANVQNWICLSIRDNGFGMDSDQLTRIFDPFYTTKAKGKGTGMGLAVIRGIVSSIKGFIEVDSEKGKGTEFRVYLPQAAPLEPRKSKAKPVDSLAGTGRIFILDDEPQILKLMSEFLTRLGYAVQTEISPEAALELLTQDETFDLLITDLTMPRMNGFEVARAVKNHKPEMPIFMISGIRDGRTTQLLRSSGIDKFFQKPLDFKQFARETKNILAQYRSGTLSDGGLRSSIGK
ncbi:MAG: PAS domain S-box protein [Acidobacteria bacterium]|nr:PAS domain S-box protein [Acidobacteriota bacterium]MCB9399551.1 PAS domain S-box protein [Acidobacteriota bacterium]